MTTYAKGSKPTTWLSEARPAQGKDGPKWFPVLQEGDLLKGAPKQDGRCCFGGWVNWTFGRNPEHGLGFGRSPDGSLEARVKRTLEEEARKVHPRATVFGMPRYLWGNYRLPRLGELSMPSINDNSAFTYKELADIWNRMLKRLGFDW